MTTDASWLVRGPEMSRISGSCGFCAAWHCMNPSPGCGPRERFPWSARCFGWRPRRDSNSRSRLRRAVLYPLSYGGGLFSVRWLVKGREAMYQRDWGLPLWHSFAM
jgi:hypothetical protein